MKNIYVPAAYTGYDALSDDCASMLTKTLDVLGGDGTTWKTVYNEGEDIPVAEDEV
jgi:hypothetical protein